VLFVLYLTATAVHIGWVVAHEPFFFDAWNVAKNSGAKPITPSHFFEFWKFEYTHSNPRIGQVFAYLAYKLEYFAVIATPLAYLAISLAVFVLGRAKLPSWKRGRDLALWAIAIGFLWFALPQIGKTLFCRAYCANYIYAGAIQLWFVAILRLVPETSGGRASQSRCLAYAVFGILAGACNEHTGPTMIAFFIGYAWCLRRRTGQQPTLVWSGALGAIIGFLAIFFAPGQGERYEGLGQRVSLVGRLLQRGVVGNVEILRDLMLAAAPTLGLILIAVMLSNDEHRAAIRRALRFVVLGMVVSVMIACTIFVSPKLGPRFFYVGCALLLAGFIGVADLALLKKKTLAPFVALAVIASIYAAARTIPLYKRVSKVSDSRMAALAASKPGTLFTAEAFEQIDETWWFYGDDMRDGKKREMVATYFDLAAVELLQYDPKEPLAVKGAHFVPHYEVSPAGCIDEVGGLTIGPARGFDLPGLHREIQIAVDKLRHKLGSATLRSLDVTVELDNDMPRSPLIVARWTPAGLETHVGKIERKNLSRKRSVVVPKELALPDVEIVVYQVGGEARKIGTGDTTPQYVPWKSGVYWILACRGNACFVIAATRHSA
jgi:hypothetical protein